MHILLIEDNPEVTPVILPLLDERLEAVVKEAYSIQEGIELLEKPREYFDLVVCDYHGQSTSLLKCLLHLCTQVPCIVFSDETYSIGDAFQIQIPGSNETITRSHLAANLNARIDLLLKKGFFKERKTLDSDFIRASTKRLFLATHIQSDVYIRNRDNRYIKLVREKEHFESSSLEKYLSEFSIDYFYIRKDQSNEIINHHIQVLDKLQEAEPISSADAKLATETTLEVIQDLSHKIGFTAEVQDLAKKSVHLTLKVIGAKPRLSTILTKLKSDEGKYISSHSFMLAELSCAIACSIGWKSAPTFLKLTLASFIHDLPIKENRIAAYRTIEEAQEDSQMSSDDLLTFKLHPIHAAEFARQFHEIPPDVDTILSQHHEQPDGTGFPRRAFHHQLSPLSCLFIVAHDLLHFFLNNPEGSTVDTFIKNRKEKYKAGIFRKIIIGLEQKSQQTTN
jgi:HD-GYP domain-containing protein (c-di-GMP phosphodiesterase class II)